MSYELQTIHPQKCWTTENLILPYSRSMAYKYQISIALDCIMLEHLILKNYSLSCWLKFLFKKLVLVWDWNRIAGSF